MGSGIDKGCRERMARSKPVPKEQRCNGASLGPLKLPVARGDRCGVLIMKFQIIAQSGEAWEFIKQQAEIDGTLDDPWPTVEKLLLIAKAGLFTSDELSDRHLDKRR
jgi:hypothetical protein